MVILPLLEYAGFFWCLKSVHIDCMLFADNRLQHDSVIGDICIASCMPFRDGLPILCRPVDLFKGLKEMGLGTAESKIFCGTTSTEIFKGSTDAAGLNEIMNVCLPCIASRTGIIAKRQGSGWNRWRRWWADLISCISMFVQRRSLSFHCWLVDFWCMLAAQK